MRGHCAGSGSAGRPAQRPDALILPESRHQALTAAHSQSGRLIHSLTSSAAQHCPGLCSGLRRERAVTAWHEGRRDGSKEVALSRVINPTKTAVDSSRYTETAPS